ncbi:MAG TPA: lipopolysaccharide transport periplasmic protein LptA [Gammaproteobacteria bacterium]
MYPANRKPLLLAVFAVGLLAAGGAWALKTDKNQPINVQSDHGDFRSDPKDNSRGTGIYTGHVIITQGSIVLTADRAVLHIVNNELNSADVTGEPATFVQQPDQGAPMNGEAREITYDAGKNEIVLIDNARLSQAVGDAAGAGKHGEAKPDDMPGERLMTADRIRYNTDTQRVIARAGDDEQRVHISFPPKTAAPAPSTAARPVKPVPAAATHAGTPP